MACRIEGCKNKVLAVGLCSKHYSFIRFWMRRGVKDMLGRLDWYEEKAQILASNLPAKVRRLKKAR